MRVGLWDPLYFGRVEKKVIGMGISGANSGMLKYFEQRAGIPAMDTARSQLSRCLCAARRTHASSR